MVQERQEDVPKWRVRAPRKAEARAVDFVDDAYGEYYPMAVRCGQEQGGKGGKGSRAEALR